MRLIAGSGNYSYATLDALGDRIAYMLRSQGIGRGDRVAIFLDNRAEAVVSLFAVLKARAVFVIINRSTKREKLSQILDDCAAAAIVTDDRALDAWPELFGTLH